WVKEQVESGELSLHGLWTNIGEGGLEYYDTQKGQFLPV
ncbi:MAG: carbonic anhydrase, partial [Rhodobacteraceae bacterium]|nr:carbonic anhydrase [Paracoccaceae bacterium]